MDLINAAWQKEYTPLHGTVAIVQLVDLDRSGYGRLMTCIRGSIESPSHSPTDSLLLDIDIRGSEPAGCLLSCEMSEVGEDVDRQIYGHVVPVSIINVSFPNTTE